MVNSNLRWSRAWVMVSAHTGTLRRGFVNLIDLTVSLVPSKHEGGEICMMLAFFDFTKMPGRVKALIGQLAALEIEQRAQESTS